MKLIDADAEPFLAFASFNSSLCFPFAMSRSENMKSRSFRYFSVKNFAVRTFLPSRTTSISPAKPFCFWAFAKALNAFENSALGYSTAPRPSNSTTVEPASFTGIFFDETSFADGASSSSGNSASGCAETIILSPSKSAPFASNTARACLRLVE